MDNLALPESVHVGSDALLWLALFVIAWFIRQDRMAFQRRVEKLESALRSDGEIMALVNGKYLSRREYELERGETDKAVERLRKWHDHDRANEIAPIPLLVHQLENIEDRLDRITPKIATIQASMHKVENIEDRLHRLEDR